MLKKYDPKLGSTVFTIYAGELYVSTAKEIISTVLGSCISVCLFDEEAGIGGMNHFMLPENAVGNKRWYQGLSIDKEALSEKSLRYGIHAMEVLIAEMQKKGAERRNLRAKVFGGGQVLKKNGSYLSVGEKNIGFARAFLKMEGIKIEKENVGKDFGRKIFYLTERNAVFVKKVPMESAVGEEEDYVKRLLKFKEQGDVTLF